MIDTLIKRIQKMCRETGKCEDCALGKARTCLVYHIIPCDWDIPEIRKRLKENRDAGRTGKTPS
jgi:hypothetical protein